nr:hypothetical protein [Clostridioides difficile]
MNHDCTMHYCTPAWATEGDSVSKKKKKKKKKGDLAGKMELEEKRGKNLGKRK